MTRGVTADVVLRFKVTPEERERIEALAQEEKLSLSAYLRKRALREGDER